MISWPNKLTANPLPLFLRFQTVDIRPDGSLPSSMRWTAILALIIFLPTALASAQTEAPKPAGAITHLTTPKAEPENGEAYAPPAPTQDEGPSDADIGPVQRHFVLASNTDDLESTQLMDNATMALHEKVALDKRITVPLVHDVQNDSEGKAAHNHALDFELKYLNWGAVTQEQLRARRGHYFTITVDNDGPKADLVARFEYRQVKSKEIIRTLTQKIPKPSGTTRSYFAVINKAYLAYGPVCSWRFTILKGDTIVAEAKSFLW